MTLGERGGSTATLDEGIALVETHKPVLSNAIRYDVLDWLESHETWHRNDLRVDVPAESKNAVGAVVNGLISSGRIVETGERRKSSDPASHARKSNVYRLAGTGGSEVGEASVAASCGPGRSEGDTAFPEEGNEPGGESSAGATPMAPVDPPRLFDVVPESPGLVDLDQREAA